MTTRSRDAWRWLLIVALVAVELLGRMQVVEALGGLGKGLGALRRRIGRRHSLLDAPSRKRVDVFLSRRGGSYQGYGNGGGGYDYNDNPYDGYDEDDYDDRSRYQQPPPRQVSVIERLAGIEGE